MVTGLKMDHHMWNQLDMLNNIVHQIHCMYLESERLIESGRLNKRISLTNINNTHDNSLF